MTFNIGLNGSKGTIGGVRAEVECCLHSWDLSDQIYPEYMNKQMDREDFEDDFTVNVVSVQVEDRLLDETSSIMAALVKLWNHLETNIGLFACAKDDDATAIELPDYDIKQTAAGRAFCDRLASLHDSLVEVQWRGSSEATESVVTKIEDFCK